MEDEIQSLTWGKKAAMRINRDTIKAEDVLKQLDIDAEVYNQWQRDQQQASFLQQDKLTISKTTQAKSRKHIVAPVPETANTKFLKETIKLKKRQLESLTERNAELIKSNEKYREIIEQIQSTVYTRVQDQLTTHIKLRTGIATLSEKLDEDLRSVRDNFSSFKENIDKELLELQETVKKKSLEVAQLQNHLHTLETYKDREYPSKIVKISHLRRQLENLRMSNKDEEKDLVAILEETMNQALKDNKMKMKNFIETVTTKSVSKIHPTVHDLAIENEFFKKEISFHLEKSEQLNNDIKRAKEKVDNLSNASDRRLKPHVFPEIYGPSRSYKCLPNEDIQLELPERLELPI